MANIEEAMRAALEERHKEGYDEGFKAGLAAALERIGNDVQQLASEYHVPVKSSAPSLDASIETLSLTVRTYNCLERKSIHTVKDIYTFHGEDPGAPGLADIRNLGPKSFEELNTKLTKLGYSPLRWVSFSSNDIR